MTNHFEKYRSLYLHCMAADGRHALALALAVRTAPRPVPVSLKRFEL